MRIACEVLYKYSDENLFNLLSEIFTNIGFTPKYYSIFYNQFKKPKNDIAFNEKEIIKLFKKTQKPESIKIVNQIIDDDTAVNLNQWFKISLNIESEKEFQETIGNSILLEWSNFNLDFLTGSTFFKKIISNESLIYCYLFNQEDVMEQSNKIYNQFEENKHNKKTIKNQYGDEEIDISENWGRYEKVRSVNFLAGSKMYFGQGFNEICNIEELEKLQYSKKVENAVQIELYPINNNPDQYREAQKNYWNFIEKSKKEYEKLNELDFTKWLLSKSKKK